MRVFELEDSKPNVPPRECDDDPQDDKWKSNHNFEQGTKNFEEHILIYINFLWLLYAE